MPPRKKNAWKTVVGFSRVERALLQYLQGLSHRTVNDELRSALRFYSRHHPQFDPEAFATHVRKHELTETAKGVEREQLIQEVNAFLGSFGRPTRAAGSDRISSFENRDMSFHSTAKDFDLD